jgi:Protein of unknown function (DUF1353)
VTLTDRVRRVLDRIQVEPVWPRYNTWLLLTTFEYRLGSDDGAEFVRIEAGFITDFASIPRPLWWLWPPSQGPYLAAALVHDCLYKTGYVVNRQTAARRTIDRGEADDLMKEVMEVCETPLPTKRGIFRGVRLGGWLAWRKHRKADAHV